MKALSLIQPWAWLILHPEFLKKHGLPPKEHENRSWRLPLNMYHQRVALHQSKRKELQWWPASFPKLELPQEAWQTGLMGEVTLTGCVRHADSPWFFGPFAFVCANPAPYAKPLECRGALGFFDVELPWVKAQVGWM